MDFSRDFSENHPNWGGQNSTLVVLLEKELEEDFLYFDEASRGREVSSSKKPHRLIHVNSTLSGRFNEGDFGAMLKNTQLSLGLSSAGLSKPRLIPGSVVKRNGVSVYFGDAKDLYSQWESPIAIVSDGAYGIGSFPGDPLSHKALPEWYEPHIQQWSRKSTPQTTLWFWNTELGWATVHPVLERYGWDYRTCHIWNKGIGHVAGNSNTQCLRKLPVVTEVCVQYIRRATVGEGEKALSLKDWLRYEWSRTGLPFSLTNQACGVRNAATRKYFTKDHLWYFPPSEAFEKLAAFANIHGAPEGRPYFSFNGKNMVTGAEWERMRAKFFCEVGVTNVWSEPAVRGAERIKRHAKCIHMNQKPLKLIKLMLRLSTEIGDMVWEPFGGLCSTAIASLNLDRLCASAEFHEEFFSEAVKRLEYYEK